MTREELLQTAKPILFNMDMVRAILDGRKTVTRRVVKPQPEKELWYSLAGYGHGKWYEKDNISGKLWTPPCHADDILYVRETWSDHYVPDEGGKPKLEYCYKADGIDIKAECLPGENNRWYPSIHMPKEAARIFLKVMGVIVERLLEIRQDCLVTVRYTGFMGMHGFWVKTGHMEVENDWWGDCSGGEVIAWQPLPEPYNQKGE